VLVDELAAGRTRQGCGAVAEMSRQDDADQEGAARTRTLDVVFRMDAVQGDLRAKATVGCPRPCVFCAILAASRERAEHE
jgi:hypothetical protein